MRRWFLLVLVLLLPLRGWVGEAMAGEMLARHIAVAAAAASKPHAHTAQAHTHTHASGHAQAPDHDCAGHAHADAGTQAQPPDAGCGTCASCQVCSSVALGIDGPALAVMDFGHTPPSARLPHFASAEPRLRDKPPIS